MINTDNLDLPKALKLIKTLETQLDEINMVSKEYENEMENVLHRLQNEIHKIEQVNKKYHITGRNLEIRVEELESENAYLSQKIMNMMTQNDKLMEHNILLEHEVHDLRKYIDCDSLKSMSSEKSSVSSFCSANSMTVSTKGSSLLIKPILGKNNGNVNGLIPTIKLSQSTVMTTTAPMSLST